MLQRGFKPRKPKVEPKKPIPEVITKREIFDHAREFIDPQTRCLYDLIYLTGCRVTEALMVRVRDIRYETIGEEKLMVVRLLTEKNQVNPIRNVPILISGEEEKLLAEDLQEYTKDMLMDENLFLMSRRNAYKKFTTTIHLNVRAKKGKQVLENYPFDLHPHYLRHCRITHIKEEYDLDIYDLMRMFGWSDPKSAMPYLHIGYKGLVKSMVVGKMSFKKLFDKVQTE